MEKRETSSMATFLDESEVRILTGRVRHGAQVRALRGMGIAGSITAYSTAGHCLLHER
uniref:Uncharacterized protein n=1 Tax=Candidatus Kentrum sp. TC TaxID=2126339 RepID=A0A450Z4F2_9GAMM|nr:MAG: protein of unknown function (DUF4224) [Candidatus Kentron sp. TC]VFK52667.1 MAG: protein of unknown function (DUF4224) [Candidatus Kentron sp. TC]